MLWVISLTLGSIACFSFLLLLYFLLSSWNPNNLLQILGIGGLTYGQIINCIFLIFLPSVPVAPRSNFSSSDGLLICCSIALTTSTCLALFWPCSTLDDIPVCGLAYDSGQLIALWVWLYIVVFIIQDILKVLMWRTILHFNWLNVKNKVHIKLDSISSVPQSDSSEF